MNRLKRFYGWVLVRYSYGKATPFLTQVVDNLSAGSFLAPLLLLQQDVVSRIIYSTAVLLSVIILSGMFLVFVGHVKIYLGLVQSEMLYSDLQRPIMTETLDNTRKILGELEKKSSS